MQSIFASSEFDMARRLFVLAVLILAMLVPLNMIEGVVSERFSRSMEVQNEIAQVWGGSQTVAGPVLALPYIRRTKALQNNVTVEHERREVAHFLPDRLDVDVKLASERRAKSLYEVPVYTAEIAITGSFAAPDFGVWNVASADVLWNEAQLSLGIDDMTGVQALSIAFDDKPVSVSPGVQNAALFSNGASGRVPGFAGTRTQHAFTINLTIQGTAWLQFLPLGKDTQVTMVADWPHPGFGGAFLPAERTIDAEGFDAVWNITYLARSYPQAWRSEDGALQIVDDGRFGVQLVTPGDTYQQTDRVTKYGILVIALTFGALFVVGLRGTARAHLVQYLLVGASLCLFYLLLLSLSEQTGFMAAYAVAAGATVVINALYVGRTVGRVAGIVVALLLAAVYAYIYVLLQLEDYSLLVGAVGLLVALVGVMYATRNIDWHSLGRSYGSKLAPMQTNAAPAGGSD